MHNSAFGIQTTQYTAPCLCRQFAQPQPTGTAGNFIVKHSVKSGQSQLYLHYSVRIPRFVLGAGDIEDSIHDQIEE